MPNIEMQGVRKEYPGHRLALDGVDLAIRDREFFAVLGPSGSGKSTILRILAGLVDPTSGKVSIGGRDAATLRPRDRDAAIVFQNPALYPHLDVRRNLAASARAAGVDRAEIDARVGTAAELLGLGVHLGVRPSRLSGGQAQRVALGRAFVRRPSLLLLDEPFSNLDPPLRASLIDDLAALHRRIGCTTVLVTHDQQEAAALADRIAFLDQGRVIQVGPSRDFFDRPDSPAVALFFGAPPRAVVPAEVGPEEGRLVLGDGGWRLVARGVAIPSAMRAEAGPFLLGIGPEEAEVIGFADEEGEPPPSGFLVPCDRVIERERGRLARVRLGPFAGWARVRPGLEVAAGRWARVVLHLDRACLFPHPSGRRREETQRAGNLP